MTGQGSEVRTAAEGPEIAPIHKRVKWLTLTALALVVEVVVMQAISQQFMGQNKILIVEDHCDSREAFRALFEAFGYDVAEANNGRDAIESAARERPALILMDIMMPELDGFDAAREIRMIPGMELTPIIAVTAMEGARELALQAGMSDYVRKPVDIHGLLAKVSGWLEPTAA